MPGNISDQIFSADGWTGPSVRGSTRGPRGPKKCNISFKIAYISIEVFRGAVEQTLVRHLCAVPRIRQLLPTC